jgi:hypothetical protein
MFPKMVSLKENSEKLSKRNSISSEVRVFALLSSLPPHNHKPTGACARLGFRAKITLIVVTKGHKVAFFPRSNADGDPKGNCRAGTVIDTDVVSPVETDYYLYGHAGLLGTSKPAHYNVLYDENNFTCVVS